MQDRGKCGTENAGLENAGPIQIMTSTSTHAKQTSILYVGLWCDEYQGLHRDGNSGNHRLSVIRNSYHDV